MKKQISEFETNVRDCLNNWLGYGNPNGKIWFIGTEEGGAEIWRTGSKSIEESLSIRRDFGISMDFKHVWEDLYNVPLNNFKGPSVWRYVAAFLLLSEGKKIEKDTINSYIFEEKRLGSENSQHFMCEFLPLPKPKKFEIKPYSSIWATNEKYRDEVMPKRIELINNTLMENESVRLIIVYELYKEMVSKLNTNPVDEWVYCKESQKEKYELRKILLGSRNVYLLSTPFFGNGRITYFGINNAYIKLQHSNLT
jgi:hypothetical protein